MYAAIDMGPVVCKYPNGISQGSMFGWEHVWVGNCALQWHLRWSLPKAWTMFLPTLKTFAGLDTRSAEGSGIESLSGDLLAIWLHGAYRSRIRFRSAN